MRSARILSVVALFATSIGFTGAAAAANDPIATDPPVSDNGVDAPARTAAMPPPERLAVAPRRQ